MEQPAAATGEQTAATLILNRQPGKRDLWRAYRVMVDGSQVAVLNEGETRKPTLSPGSHEIWVKLDWARSRKVRLDMSEGSRTYLRGRAPGNPWMVPIDSLFRPTRYIGLTEHETATTLSRPERVTDTYPAY